MNSFTDYEKYVKDINGYKPNSDYDIAEPIDIAGAIILRRAEIGMTREDLSFKTGVTATTIANIETMKMSPSFEVIVTILNSMGLKLKICPK